MTPSTPESETPTPDEFGQGALRKVTAIVRCGVVEAVEKRLKAMHVPGISVMKVKGYGEYADFFRSDWLCNHARLEVFCSQLRADEIAKTICEAACSGEPGDGIVAILPVEAIYRVRTCAHASAEDLGDRVNGGGAGSAR